MTNSNKHSVREAGDQTGDASLVVERLEPGLRDEPKADGGVGQGLLLDGKVDGVPLRSKVDLVGGVPLGEGSLDIPPLVGGGGGVGLVAPRRLHGVVAGGGRGRGDVAGRKGNKSAAWENYAN